MGTGALSPGIKRPGREADHSPPSSAEVKNAWSYISTPPIRLHDVVLNKSTGTTLPLVFNFTFCVHGINKYNTMKSSGGANHVKCLHDTDVSRTVRVPIIRDLIMSQTPDAADSPRRLHWIYSPRKLQIKHNIENDVRYPLTFISQFLSRSITLL
jgi:hypothetical protein